MLALALVGVGGLFGLALATAVRRWPSKDPSAPRLEPSGIRDTVHRHPRLRSHLRTRFDPTAATGLALTLAVLAIVAAATSLGVLAAMVRTNSGLTHYDA